MKSEIKSCRRKRNGSFYLLLGIAAGYGLLLLFGLGLGIVSKDFVIVAAAGLSTLCVVLGLMNHK